MTVYFNKKRGCWDYNFRLGGRRYATHLPKSITSRRAAQLVEDEAKHRARLAPKIPAAKDLPIVKVLGDLCEGWKDTKDWLNKRRYARELIAYFKPETPMRAIDGAQIQDYITWAKQQPIMVWTGGCSHRLDDPKAELFWKPHPKGKLRGPATVNRYLVVLRMAFGRAHNTRDPMTGERAVEDVPKIEELTEPKRKARPTPDDVVVELASIIPDHLLEALRLTLYFGFRRGEVFGLEIRHVDFTLGGIRLYESEVKDREDTFLPGGRDAMQFLAQLVDQANARGVTHLITWRRHHKDPEAQAREPWRPIKRPKSAWRTAMDKIERKFGCRWRWHDLRAAYITHVALTSGPLAAQSLARHSDFETTQAYIEVADDVRRAAAEQVASRPVFGMIRGGKS